MLRLFFIKTFIFSLSVLVLACSRENNPEIPEVNIGKNHPTIPGVYINEKCTMGIGELKMSDPVLYVNGEKITKRDFEALLVLRDRIWRLRQNIPLDVSKTEMDEFRYEAGDSLLIELIQRALFRQYAKKIGNIPPQEKVEQAGRDLLKVLRRPNSTVNGLADAIGGDAGEIFRKIPFVDAQDAISRQSVTTNDLDSVSDEELKARVAFVEKFDANAESMNKKARERLLEAKKRILAGGDIVQEAKKIFDTVHPEYAEKWGRFEIQEFPADEDIHQWLLTAKEGDISDPLDTEDGIAIIKVLEKGKGNAPPGMMPPDAFTLVRCTVKACEKMQYQNPREMRAQLLLWKRQEAQKKLGMMLTAQAVIEYPNGTNLFTRALQEGK